MGYNLFAQQKQKYYPNADTVQQNTPSQVQGETPEQFAAGKQAANSETGAVSQPVQPIVQPTPVVKTPAVSSQQKQYTGGSNNPQGALDYLNSLYTSPEQEEKLRKASVMNQRIMAVGDALRHIGNIYNTTKGAPAQQFNNPVNEEYARYQQGKALRDRANQIYYNYQQQKAQQDAAMEKWKQQFRYNQAKDTRDYALKKNESDARANLNEARIQTQNILTYLNELKAKGQITENERKEIVNKYLPQKEESVIARNNRTGGGRSGGGGGRRGKGMDEYTVTSETSYTFDTNGNRTGSKTVKNRTVAGSPQPIQTSTNAYGGTRHGSGGKGKENKFGVRPAK